MAVISSLISFGFFGQVRGALGLVAERSIPAVTAALTLSAQSADLAAAAPALAYASAEGERQAALGNLQGKQIQIQRTMAQVDASGISADLRKEVEENVNKLIAAMDAIDKRPEEN